MVDTELKTYLDRELSRWNTENFIQADPVQFPRRFGRLEDIEIVSLLCATIAWGRREMILRSCERLLDLLEGEPYRFVMEGEFLSMEGERNIHRTFFVRNLQHYLRALREIYRRYGTLQDFARSLRAADDAAPAWVIAGGINRVMADLGCPDSRCMPQNLRTTALKRLNMALRWLVRDDGIVDLGVWDIIRPSQLYIPLDVHVGNTSRALGLLTRAGNDRKAVEELTAQLRAMRPHDPVAYDFALFSISLNAKRGLQGGTPSDDAEPHGETT